MATELLPSPMSALWPMERHEALRRTGGWTFGVCVALYFSHWVGIGPASASIFLVFVCALALKGFKGSIRKDSVKLVAFMVAYAAIVLVLQAPTLADLSGWSPLSTPRLLLLGLGPWLVFALVSLLPPLSPERAIRFFVISYYVLALTIVAEWVLLNVVGVSLTWMPAFRDSYSYNTRVGAFYRPFGLTGNAPVNGSILVIAAWILIFAVRVRRPGRLLLATGAVLLLNNSGQALLAYAALIAFYLNETRKGLARIFVLLLGAGAAVYIVRAGLIPKLSWDYMLAVGQFLGLQNIAAMDVPSLILGGYGKYSKLFEDVAFMTEFYPIFSLTRLGALLTVGTWWYMYARLPKQHRFGVFFLLAVASAHYPTILYVEQQVLIGAYLFWSVKKSTVARATA